MAEHQTVPGGSDLSFEINKAIARDPLPLTEASIGAYFRNALEIEDTRNLIAGIQEEHTTITVGLFGSRLRGRVRYKPEDLLRKLNNQYGRGDLQQTSAVLHALENVLFHLQEIIDQTPNLNNVSLGNSLSSEERDMLTTTNFYIPPEFQLIQDFTLETLGRKVLLPIQLLVPDIDIAVLVRDSSEDVGGIIVGEKSGTAFQVTYVSPSDLKRSNESPLVKDPIAAVIDELRPFRL